MPQLEIVRTESLVAALLLAKSTPYVITALVGMKGQRVADNLKVNNFELLKHSEFLAAFGMPLVTNHRQDRTLLKLCALD